MPPIIKKPTPRYTKSDSTSAKSMVEIRKKRQAGGAEVMRNMKKSFTKEDIDKNPSMRATMRGASVAAATDTTLNKALGEAHSGDYNNEDLRTAMKIRKKK